MYVNYITSYKIILKLSVFGYYFPETSEFLSSFSILMAEIRKHSSCMYRYSY